jgi:hypothetical protein
MRPRAEDRRKTDLTGPVTPFRGGATPPFSLMLAVGATAGTTEIMKGY